MCPVNCPYLLCGGYKGYHCKKLNISLETQGGMPVKECTGNDDKKL